MNMDNMQDKLQHPMNNGKQIICFFLISTVDTYTWYIGTVCFFLSVQKYLKKLQFFKF